MRTRIRKTASLLAVAGAATLLLGTAGSANAASAPASQAGTKAVSQPAAGWEFFDDYWTFDDCEAEGYRGRDRGEWLDFQCRPGPVDWNLWVLRP
ncbi:hypothetical protein [Streptomyces sp. enrichment culture]|uniref:hypothetical protein n=1 Tax=Streptomyces sp. enrichment culture TaxID=1795815 RepID=UPI003F56C946